MRTPIERAKDAIELTVRAMVHHEAVGVKVMAEYERWKQVKQALTDERAAAMGDLFEAIAQTIPR